MYATLSLQSAVLSFVEETDTEIPKVEKKSTKTQTADNIVKSQEEKHSVGGYTAVQPVVQKPKEEIKIPVVNSGDKVKHKTFGEGTALSYVFIKTHKCYYYLFLCYGIARIEQTVVAYHYAVCIYVIHTGLRPVGYAPKR